MFCVGLAAHVDQLDAGFGGDGAQGLQRVFAVGGEVDAVDAHADVVFPAHDAGGRAALVPQHFPQRGHALLELISHGRARPAG